MKSWPEQPNYLSKAYPRVDGPIKVTGVARYAYDIQPQGWLYGMILRSPFPSAEITEIDLEAARRLPGVEAVVLHRELPTEVRYYGQELAAVAATSKQAAQDALRAMKITARELPFVVKELEAVREEAPRVFADHKNISIPRIQEEGDVDGAYEDASASLESFYMTQVQLHQSMETHGNTVIFDGNECTCWASTQGIFSVRDSLARGLDLDESKVRVITEVMGGGFGSKFGAGVEGILAALLSREAGGRAVKLMLTRFDEALAVGNRPSTFQQVSLAADDSGKITGYKMNGIGCAGFAGGGRTEAGGGGARFQSNYLYTAPNRSTNMGSVSINAGSSRAFRAPGHPQGSVSMEGLMDDLAMKLGIDPVAFRIKNDPFPIRRKQFEIGAARFDWDKRYRDPGSSTGSLKTGIGCAGARWGGGGGDNSAEAQVNPDGTIEVRIGTQDIGTGTRTLVVLVAAEVFNVELDRITGHIGDTRYPPSGGSGGSNTAASVAPAVFQACINVMEKLRKQSGMDDVSGDNFDKACSMLMGQPLVASGDWREDLRSSGTGGVQFAEVEVDTETGFVKINEMLAVHDGGMFLNTLTSRSQVHGGIIMGIGYALYEERIMDPLSGVVLNPNFETYKVPGIADVPPITVVMTNFPERGVIGIGEPVHIPTASAIANAVANALGLRIYEIPITPNRVLSALGRTGQDDYQKKLEALRYACNRFSEMVATPFEPQENHFTRLV